MPSNSREIRLRRLYFRSAHRGAKETDLVLGPFAASALSAMSDAELDLFEALLEESDHDLWDWIAGAAEPEARYASLIARLRERHALAG